MANLAAETKDMGFQLEQVQDFMPTPFLLQFDLIVSFQISGHYFHLPYN
jgi:hypothetical protein